MTVHSTWCAPILSTLYSNNPRYTPLTCPWAWRRWIAQFQRQILAGRQGKNCRSRSLYEKLVWDLLGYLCLSLLTSAQPTCHLTAISEIMGHLTCSIAGYCFEDPLSQFDHGIYLRPFMVVDVCVCVHVWATETLRWGRWRETGWFGYQQ